MVSSDLAGLRFERVMVPKLRGGGQVELHVNSETGSRAVVKRLPRERVCDTPQEFFVSFPDELENPWVEIQITQCLGCAGPGKQQGVAQCLGAWRDPTTGDALLVSEYLPDGDLFAYASAINDEPGPARERQVWPLFSSIFHSILGLHSRGVAHCDLSLENVMLRPGLGQEISLIDFGMAVLGDLSWVKGVRGKPSYQAPEMHTGEAYDARSADLFSLGVVFYCLAIGHYPWYSTRPQRCRAFRCFCKHGPDVFFEQRSVGQGRKAKDCLSPKLRKLLAVLLDLNPSKRHAAAALLSNEAIDVIPQCAWGG